MSAATKQTILVTAKNLFAKDGYEGFSMRTLAKESNVGLSSIYHFFEDKDVLLKTIFNTTRKELGQKRAALPIRNSASETLYDRILFQFENIADVVFLLKYYLHFRKDFLRLHDGGYLPQKSYLHIREVLESGIKSNEFYIQPSELVQESKVITHAVNGFLLEYYPDPPQHSELQKVTKYIHSFLMKSLTNREVPMK